MSDESNIARKVIFSFLAKGDDFTKEQIEDEIIKKGGLLRVIPGTTVTEYLSTFESTGYIKYSPSEEMYSFNDSTAKR